MDETKLEWWVLPAFLILMIVAAAIGVALGVYLHGV
jgi:hypothetical protein